MVQLRDIPSNWSTGINSTDRTFVDPIESIGTTGDAAADSVSDENSAISLLKGIAVGMNVPAGSGDAAVNDSAKVYADPLETLGGMDDPAAADTNEQSAISLMKGLLATAVGA